MQDGKNFSKIERLNVKIGKERRNGPEQPFFIFKIFNKDGPFMMNCPPINREQWGQIARRAR